MRWFQWLSTAFTIWMIISWWAVGSPITTINFLRNVQELVVIASEKLPRKEEQPANEYEGYYKEQKKRPLGKFSNEHNGW